MGSFSDDDDEDEDDILKENVRRRYRRRRSYQAPQTQTQTTWEEDEDFISDDDLATEIINILTAIEHIQQRLYNYQNTLAQFLRRYPDGEAAWHRFLAMGGVTADDFRRYVSGDLRPRITKTRKHLRLVSSRKTVPLKLIRKPGNDDAA